ncbi:MAG TPA: ATP-binding protein [Streptosporangiaceae bacterium]|nr:ATP-binding protein [Streptosporangiaceae bacterium]
MRTKGFIVVAIPLVTLIGIASANLVLLHQEHQERSVALAASAVTSSANQVLADAVNAETSVRAYAATRGDARFLAPYRLTLTRIGADQALLRRAAAAEGDSRQEIALSHTVTSVMSQLGRIRSTVAGGGVTLPTLVAALRAQKKTMDLLRGQTAALMRGPSAVVLTQRARISAMESAITLFNIIALALGVLAGLVGVALFTSGIARRISENAVNADRLGAGQSLAPSATSRDEIGRVGCSLIRAESLLASRAADLVTARDEALRATGAKNGFLSHTSHELRTPLNSILGFTQLLEMSDLGDEDRDSVERILSAGRHLLALINEIIDISRIESGDLSLSLEPVAIRPLVAEISQLMTPLAAGRSISIASQVADPALAVTADRHRLRQVLVNLMSNAVKYNRLGGTITVTSRAEAADKVSVVVADTGPGLAPEDLESIFVPFERVGAEQTAVEGTGIGLPLARSMAEAMGGRLTASSVRGEGSAFTISLPRAPDVASVPAQDGAPSAAGGPAGRDGAAARDGTAGSQSLSGASLAVLYIDDNPANVEVVSRLLKSWPQARLTSAATGRAGIERAASDVPDVILLDLHLPDMSGESVLAELKAEPVTAAIPVVMLSADATPGTIRRLLARGARAYLTKPLDLAEVAEQLRSAA